MTKSFFVIFYLTQVQIHSEEAKLWTFYDTTWPTIWMYQNVSHLILISVSWMKVGGSWRKMEKHIFFLSVYSGCWEKVNFFPKLPLIFKILLICLCSNPNITKNVVKYLQELFSYLIPSLNSVIYRESDCFGKLLLA